MKNNQLQSAAMPGFRAHKPESWLLAAPLNHGDQRAILLAAGAVSFVGLTKLSLRLLSTFAALKRKVGRQLLD
jgi:hypothetical protein